MLFVSFVKSTTLWEFLTSPLDAIFHRLSYSFTVWAIMTPQLCPFTRSPPCRTQWTSGSSSLRTSAHRSYRKTLWWLCLQTVEMLCLGKHTCQSNVIGYESWVCETANISLFALLMCWNKTHGALCLVTVADRQENTALCLFCSRCLSLPELHRLACCVKIQTNTQT